ncbi:uncharacterized protein SCHCODRAFT_01282002 [Schizophyllum commune H4-8]|uniref:uncharacterized protein n=1 Tax=Schizophyllum commune (strain H4-8 / FGSC 9210) TaxID=578458 RepID=UPI0021601BD4|nr:uncharacterized protein SCHCODRAFT_01282002 [Schizophyllum commune H4-8]KAI5895040.1 hypothetical protein SCHCODRAFT_01282002 [Schizophyllum commune H4-8]
MDQYSYGRGKCHVSRCTIRKPASRCRLEDSPASRARWKDLWACIRGERRWIHSHLFEPVLDICVREYRGGIGS